MSDAARLEAFRRSRGLLSADDLSDWLHRSGLTAEDWAARVVAGEGEELPGALPAGNRLPMPEAPVPMPAGEEVMHVWMGRSGACAEAALRTVGRVVGAAVGPLPQMGADASLADIVAAIRGLGLDAEAVKVSRRRSEALPVPFIAHVDGHHWIVVHRVSASEVVVSDPARGAGRLARGAFDRRWSGWAAVVTRAVHRD